MQSSNDSKSPIYLRQNLVVGVETPLQEKYFKCIRADASHAEKNHIRSVQIWRHRFIIQLDGDNFVHQRIYQAEVDDGTITRTHSN